MKYSFVEIVDSVLKSKIPFEIKHSSFPSALFEVLKSNETKVVLVDCDSGREWTAKQLFDAIITLSVRFLEYEISKGDVVACFCTNSDYHLIAMLSL
ncbi:hypothetical protein B4U80_14750, partial [Leptotrombidium deliense]